MTPSKEWEAEHVHRVTSKADAVADTVDNAPGGAVKTATETTMTTGVVDGTVTGTKINEVEIKPDTPLQTEGVPKNTVTGEKVVTDVEQAKTILTAEQMQKAKELVGIKENGATKIDILEQDIKSLEAKAAGMNKFERAEINKEIELKRSQIERLQRQVNTADAETAKQKLIC